MILKIFIAQNVINFTPKQMDKPDKRYIVFGYDQYESQGGFCDKLESFHILNHALFYVKYDSFTIHEIYDRIEGVKIEIDNYI